MNENTTIKSFNVIHSYSRVGYATLSYQIQTKHHVTHTSRKKIFATDLIVTTKYPLVKKKITNHSRILTCS